MSMLLRNTYSEEQDDVLRYLKLRMRIKNMKMI